MRNASILVCITLSAALSAQSNTVPGLDGATSQADSLAVFGRLGAFPNGTNGCAMLTQSCNRGNVNIWFHAAMDPRHPLISSLVCRESDGRFVQISDRSHVKHAFLSTNSGGCGQCRNPGTGTLLGVGCSDTYGAGLNASRYYLGPADEIDPWLGAWNPVGSYFDRGDPDVGPPRNRDGQRSLTQGQTNAFNGIKNRVKIHDDDLNVANARYFYGAYYVFQREHESVRDNNSRTREFTPRWNGSQWSFSNTGAAPIDGTMLRHWSGARIDSNTNGNDDGRIFVAVKVTGPNPNGIYRYEYAVHNRDNNRGAASFRIPFCGNPTISNVFFKDLDRNAANDWTTTQSAGVFSFLAGADNSLDWNTIYNFGFDVDKAPVDGDVTLDQARPGGGAGSIMISTLVPGFEANRNLGAGCGNPVAPTLTTVGNPPRATIPNPNFGLQVSNLTPLNSVVINVALSDVAINLGSGCTLFTDPATTWAAFSGLADFGGNYTVAVPVPNNPALEGATLTFQGIELDSNGVLFGRLDLSNGLKVRIGNRCP